MTLCKKIAFLFATACCTTMLACQPEKQQETEEKELPTAVQPALVSEAVPFDTDDPAFWINPSDPSKSLVIGTDKGGGDEFTSGIFVFDLNGKIIHEKSIKNISRTNNVDIAYGFSLGGEKVDIAVATERGRNLLRVFSLPKMDSIDNGGIPVFEGETQRSPMGVGLYKNPETEQIYAIVSRKDGPQDGTYLWQYLLEDNGQGSVVATLVRKFGKFEGGKEIEAIAVDSQLGYVYYSDETFGVRKYYADPEKGNEELALFATQGFARDHEGISIYAINDGTGYILVSDQQANQFHVFPREGMPENPHEHPLIKLVKVATRESDGSEVTSASLNDTFLNGLFVAMSDDKTFQFYKWEDIAGDDLIIAKDGKKPSN